MVKKLKVHEKPVFKVKFIKVNAAFPKDPTKAMDYLREKVYGIGVPEAIAPLKAKATAQDRKLLEHLKYGASVMVGQPATQAYGIYVSGALEHVSFTRDGSRNSKRYFAKKNRNADVTVHRVTVVKGDRVR